MNSTPYIAGNPVKGQVGFFGRDDIFREVMQVMHDLQSNAIVLYGQRRIGKTSVLLELERRLETDGEFTPVYFDLQDKAAKPLADVLFELAQRIAAKIGQTLPSRANFDESGLYFRKIFLPAMSSLASRRGVVLLFDEFDVLDSPERGQAGKAFFPYLRDWMANVEGVHFVFVIGRRPEDLSTETMSTFKGVRASHVSLFDQATTEILIRQSERAGSLKWSDAAIKKVWEWGQGHPFFTQLLCSVVWEDLHSLGQVDTPASAADVEAVIDQALKQGANAFVWIWDGLPPAERVVMSAMAEAGEVVITQEKLVEILNRSGVRLIVRELELAPDTLVDWGLLRPIQDGFRFVVPLLRRWVANNRPIRRVKEELDRIEPLAESLFQTGQRFYQLKQLVEAESQLRHSLRINPNHLKSRLLLGRVLLETGNAVESVPILREAYQYDEGAARAELVRALLAVAETQRENEKLESYENVLAIDPYQAIAVERRKAIWLSRGNEALRQNDWEAALEAFKTVGAREQINQIAQLVRNRDRDQKIAAIEEAEVEEQWELAIEHYETLLREYPGDRDLIDRLEWVRLQNKLSDLYNRAVTLFEKGKTSEAQRLLVAVITEQPDYKEASLYLLSATSNVKFDELKASVRSLNDRQKYQQRSKKAEVIQGEKDPAPSFFTSQVEAESPTIKDEYKKRLWHLSLWNPFDYLRLLWWLIVSPYYLYWYEKESDYYQGKLLQRQARWLASALVWWPLLGIYAWLLATSVNVIFNESRFYMVFVIAAAWLLNNLEFWQEYKEDRLYFRVGAISFASATLMITSNIGSRGFAVYVSFAIITIMFCGTAAALVVRFDTFLYNKKYDIEDIIFESWVYTEHDVPSGLAAGAMIAAYSGGFVEALLTFLMLQFLGSIPVIFFEDKKVQIISAIMYLILSASSAGALVYYSNNHLLFLGSLKQSLFVILGSLGAGAGALLLVTLVKAMILAPHKRFLGAKL